VSLAPSITASSSACHLLVRIESALGFSTSDDAHLAVRGATFLLDDDGSLLYEHRDTGMSAILCGDLRGEMLVVVAERARCEKSKGVEDLRALLLLLLLFLSAST